METACRESVNREQEWKERSECGIGKSCRSEMRSTGQIARKRGEPESKQRTGRRLEDSKTVEIEIELSWEDREKQKRKNRDRAMS